ncbi:hypothetical protein [Marivita geojedonensis]|uniref:Lipoprotein n=1 Tax=Marivita geojedonensis TaxID=1123756 RepID=A0A1X4N8F4_9RHOB|nr:hypothetical protein [Marivita geojedonensis]OSQ42533.1 hypothetical protein MGEO_20465 [Marivita geojedonensis]PRY69875.1 hypothetical protein CLV76_1545 [Marivita geojedonensis]
MKSLVKLTIGSIALASLAACVEDTGSSSAPAQGMPTVGSSTDVTSFEGARAGQAEGGLRALGYESIRSEGLTTYWFNRDTGACARITTSEGRYSDVTMLPAEDC